MTAENNGPEQESREEQSFSACCSPEKFAEMMTKCTKDMKCDCSSMVQQMMKGWCQPEPK